MICPALRLDGSSGMAGALAALDCRTGEATGQAFGRLFGSNGVLLPALTVLLTLFVGLYAIGLLTGRARISLSSLTPRMLQLGLVLTFATSWMAYSQVVWTLATGAPDQIASVLAGTHGSATTAFAQSLDRIFAAISDAAQAAGKPAEALPAGSAPPPPAAPLVGGFSAATVLGVSGMMLLLGTVGVLVTSKIALAALLAVGPVFIVLALFGGTRGLFEGWLRAVVLFALVPLFATVIGGGTIAVIEPIAHSLQMAGGDPPPAAVTALFLAAFVYCALMVMVVKTAATIVSGWRVPGGAPRERAGEGGVAMASAGPATIAAAPVGQPAAGRSSAATTANDRVRSIVSGLPAIANDVAGVAMPSASGGTRRIVVAASPPGEPLASYAASRRPEGVGSRFRAPPKALSKDHVS
jgi:type IV secretion system protein VirB6